MTAVGVQGWSQCWSMTLEPYWITSSAVALAAACFAGFLFVISVFNVEKSDFVFLVLGNPT